MLMKKVTLEVPSEMARYLQVSDEKTKLQRNALLLYPFVKNNTLSHGKVAEMLGISKRELIDIYCDFGIAYLSMDISEIKDEVEKWEKSKTMNQK